MLAHLTGAGLSAAAGLNAYIPLLLVGVSARFTDAVALPFGFGWLSDWWALAILFGLLVVEFVLDKIPVVDHINDLIQTVIRPVSGGAVAAAGSAAAEADRAMESALNPDDSMLTGWALGIVLALAVHATKAVLRLAVNTGTIGLGTPLASLAEDTGSLGMSLLAVFAPILAGIGLVVMAVLAWRLWLWRRRWKRRRARRRATTSAA